MGRIGEAALLPLIVFPSAAVVAISIGLLLHQVPRLYAPVVALLLCLLVTGAGFFFSARAWKA